MGPVEEFPVVMIEQYEVAAPEPQALVEFAISAVVLPGQVSSFSEEACEEAAKWLQLTRVLQALVRLDQALEGVDAVSLPVNALFETRTSVDQTADSMSDPNAMAEYALQQLAQRDVTPLEGGGFSVKTAVGFVQIVVLSTEVENGSCRLKRVLRIVLPERETWKSLIYGALLSHMLAGPAGPTGQPHNPQVPQTQIIYIETSPARLPPQSVYVCSLDTSITGDRDKIIDDAIGELTGATVENPWFARQACLKVAGFYPGKIDGIPGPLTEAAEEAFKVAHKLSHIDWSSRNFARFILQAVTPRPE